MKNNIPTFNMKYVSHNKSEDFVVSRFGAYFKSHQNLHLAHKHSFYHLLLFTKGAGSHEIDFASFDVKPGQIYFMNPGQMHSWNFEGEVDGYVINFSKAFFQSFLLKPDYLEQFLYFRGVGNSVVELPYNIDAEVRSIFERILKEYELTDVLCLDFIKTLLVQLFIIISRLDLKSLNTEATCYKYNLIRKFLKLTESNVGLLKLPKEYARVIIYNTK